MKVTCNREELLNNINIVGRAVSTKTTMPILECMLIDVSPEGIKITATDLDMGIESSYIAANVLEGGKVALNAKLFSDIIRKCDGHEVSISVDDKFITKITCANSKFKLMGQETSEFPTLPDVEKDKEYKINQKEFKKMIKDTIFSVATGESKIILTGELIELKDNYIHVVSVDGFRISCRKEKVEFFEDYISVVAPGKTMSEIGKILTGLDEQFSLYFTDKHIVFYLNNCKIVSRTLEGEFLKYEQSFVDDYLTKITVNRIEILACLERASLLTDDDKKHPVVFNIAGEVMKISSVTEIGDANEELSCEFEGEGIEIAFNPKFLMDIFKVIEDESVVMYFTKSLSPCIIKPVEGDSFKYLVLPLRLKH